MNNSINIHLDAILTPKKLAELLGYKRVESLKELDLTPIPIKEDGKKCVYLGDEVLAFLLKRREQNEIDIELDF